MPAFFVFIFSALLLINTQSGWAQLSSKPTVSTQADISSNKTYTGIVAEQYTNGSPRLWKTLVNGKAEGLWLEWYPDGTLRYKAYWKNDLGHGKWEYFHPNGQLSSESFYIADIAQGIYRSYFENGQLQTDATYLNGNKNGLELIYDVNGALTKRNFYDNGQLVIDQPVLFEPGKITDLNSNEWGICFTPDGNTAYFTRRDAATKLKRIYQTTKTEKGWSMPEIAPFSTDEDEAPFINSQGTKMFFASYRPISKGIDAQKYDSNIWYMDKTADGWSRPQPIPGAVNKIMKQGDVWPANYETNPVTDAQGNLYYWTKGTQNNASNLWFSPLLPDDTFGNPVELIEPSSHKYFDSAPVFSPDGNILFFTSDNRDDGLGGADIYYAKKINGGWTKAKNLAPMLINSYYDDSCAGFSPDGKYFFFNSTRAGKKDENGELLWDIYFIETKFLLLE